MSTSDDVEKLKKQIEEKDIEIDRLRFQLKIELVKKETELKLKEKNLVLLEKAYAERFGEAEVKTVKEMFYSKAICPSCGGDGGVVGGCQRCDGKGWIDVLEKKSREVVEIKCGNKVSTHGLD